MHNGFTGAMEHRPGTGKNMTNSPAMTASTLPYEGRAFDAWAVATGDATHANNVWSKTFPATHAEIRALPRDCHRLFSTFTIVVDGTTFQCNTRHADSDLSQVAGYVHTRRVMATTLA